MPVQPKLNSPSASSRQPPGEEVAVLAMDAGGRITLASAAARKLWQAGDTELVGEAFPHLFFFEVTSREPDWLESQWEVLLAAALDQPVTLTAQPREAAPREVLVRIEKLPGATVVYLAHVRLPPEPSSGAAASALPEELAGLPVLIEKGAIGFFDLNFKDGNVHYSSGWKKLLGFSEQELANTYDTWLNLLHPDDSAAAPDRIAKKTSGGARPFALEFRMRHRRGHYVWIQGNGVQIFGPGGALERVVGVHADISERKEQEEAALAGEERVRCLSGDGPLGAFDFDFRQKRFWLSTAWKRLLGYAENENIEPAEIFRNSLPPAEAENGLEAFFLARHTGETNYLETGRLRHKDGHFLPVLLGVHRQLSHQRELLRVAGFHAPLPADSLAAGDVPLTPALLAETLATIAEALLVTDPRGTVLYLNHKAAQLTGWPAEKARGRPLGEIFRIVPRDEPGRIDDALERVLTAEEPLSLVTSHALIPAFDGAEPVPVVWTARQAADANGGLQGVIFVFRNPDELTLTPDELVKANRFESLGVLASGIAHDFNNLLTTVLGGVSLAKDNHDSSGLLDSEKACLAAKALTKQLLLFAKGGTHAKNVVEAGDILTEAARLAAAGASVQVSIETSPGVAPVLVDHAQILQVFQNLIINAVQAMPEGHHGKIWLQAGNTTLAENQIPPLSAGNYVEFEVRDNGSGIPQENLQKIFDPFFTTKKHGTGLGLATVLNIVHHHGGQIGVDSTVGEGTIFKIFLPPADHPAEIEARRAPTLRFGTGRVLFMDDDEKICTLTGAMLSSLEYKYDIAHNGEEAVALYRRYLNIGRPYDAVILDLTVIGGLGGKETFQQLHELDPDVRAIVASGYDNDEMAKRFLGMGFCGYLTKPYRVTDLGKVLKTVLG